MPQPMAVLKPSLVKLGKMGEPFCGQSANVLTAQEMFTVAFSPWMFMSEDCSPTEPAPAEVTFSSASLFSGV